MLTTTAVQAGARTAGPACLALRCPRCGEAPEIKFARLALCRGCGFALEEHDGIWLALPPDRAQYFSAFLRDYEAIRAAEGRGSHDAAYYLGLPHRDASGHNQAQWKIRAHTFDYLVRHIFPRLAATSGDRILDLGAGNGWLSYQLSQMGFRPVAVDLLLNDQDGLGAARHYVKHLPELFPRFQAEATRLPFADAQFSAVIFNASFHYVEDYREAVAEALRCLRNDGLLVIADTPWYTRESSGHQMVAERHEHFRRRFGTASASLRSQEFLTDERLGALEKALHIAWERHTPRYGLRWSLRPWIARLRRRREPARFRIYVARKIA